MGCQRICSQEKKTYSTQTTHTSKWPFIVAHICQACCRFWCICHLKAIPPFRSRLSAAISECSSPVVRRVSWIIGCRAGNPIITPWKARFQFQPQHVEDETVFHPCLYYKARDEMTRHAFFFVNPKLIGTRWFLASGAFIWVFGDVLHGGCVCCSLRLALSRLRVSICQD